MVNPRATTTSPRVVDVIVHAFSDQLELDVTVTTHKGHGEALGARAREEGVDVVVTLGGDGVVHEVVNGMLQSTAPNPVPLLATVPGGSANVFARSIGLPNDAVEATGQLLEALRAGRTRAVGLGTANERWFLVNAGLGIDAEIIAAMERHRKAGRGASPVRYLSTTLNEYFRATDRRSPALTLSREAADGGHERLEGAYLAFVQNTSPWTYFGTFALNPSPRASLDTGLDVFAVRNMRVPSALLAARRIVTGKGGDRLGKGALVSWHDVPAFTITASRPVEFQIDGEGLGPVSEVAFTAHPQALRVAV